MDPFESLDGEANSDRAESTLVRIREWLGRNDWYFDEAEEGTFLRTGVQGKNARFRIVLGVRGDGPTFLCFSLYDFNVPVARRAHLADLVNRINYTLLVGSFEMDQDDGELRFRITFPLDESELSDGQIERSLVIGATMADRFYPAFMSLIHAALPPAEALESVDRAN